MDLVDLIVANDGMLHRRVADRHGFTSARIRADILAGRVVPVRRLWLTLPGLEADPRRAAAEAGGRVGCVSAAAVRGWWIPDGASARRHLVFAPHAAAPPDEPGVVLHWTRPIVPVPRHELVESVEDALDHVASCFPPHQAVIVWESAARLENLDPAALRRVHWRSPNARALAAEVTGLSDSGLETILTRGLGHLGCRLTPQALIAGHRVDLLIGDRLVVQADGHGFHSSSADRTRDLRHDHELSLRGYTVLRFTYAQIVHDWPATRRVIERAIASGAHHAQAIVS